MLPVVLLVLFFLIIVLIGLNRSRSVKWFWPFSSFYRGESYSPTGYVREDARQRRKKQWLGAVIISILALLVIIYLLFSNIYL